MLICSQYTVNFGHSSPSWSWSRSLMRAPVGNCLSPGRNTFATFNFCFILLLFCSVAPFMRAAISRPAFSTCLLTALRCCCRFLTFSYQLSSFMLRCTLGRSSVFCSPFSGLDSVLVHSPVVIRWHITLKCLLLFYKINFFRYLARPTCLSAKKESHKNNNVMPISFTATFINREEGAACGMCFICPQKVFELK